MSIVQAVVTDSSSMSRPADQLQNGQSHRFEEWNPAHRLRTACERKDY